MSFMICLQIIGEEGGYTLEPPPAVTSLAPRHDASFVSAERIVADVLDDLDPEDHVAFRLAIVRDLLPGLHRSAAASAAVEAADRQDEQRLLGVRPDDWVDADQRLEQFVAEHGADRERDIARLLGRRVRRQIELIDPGMRDVRGFRVQPIDWSAVPTT